MSLNLGGGKKRGGGEGGFGLIGGGRGGGGGGGGGGEALGIREQAIEKYLALVKDKRDLQRKNQKVPFLTFLENSGLWQLIKQI